jgi:ubiquinone/menaquinone biosynthesis C-methylase UbiE
VNREAGEGRRITHVWRPAVSMFDQLTLPEIYERFLVEPLFRPFAEQLLTRLQPARDDSVLDVACGTGIVARIARTMLGSAARIVGVDAAPGMLAAARDADPTIDWREGDAAALPVHGDERFSCVTCHQGLQFFANRVAAVREMRRVLLPGGRLGVATWLSVMDIPFAGELHRAAEQHLGATVDVRHSFGDGEALAQLLAEGGFQDVRVVKVSGTVRGMDGPTYARLNAMAVVGMSAHAKTLSDPERAAVIDRIAVDSLAVVARFTRDGAFEFALTTNMATARA